MEVCWLVALIAVPLLVNPYGGFAFSIYKAAFLRILVGLMVALWILKTGLSLVYSQDSFHQQGQTLQARTRDFLKGPLMGPVVALILIYVLATMLSISPSTSLWGEASRMDGSYTTFALLAYFLIVAWELRTAAQVHRIVWAIIVGSSLVSLLGIAEWLGWSPWLVQESGALRLGADIGERIVGTAGNATATGAYLVLTTALLVGKWLHLWARRVEQPSQQLSLWLVGLGLLLLAHLAALLFTLSRGPWVGLVVMMAVLVAILLVKNRRWRMLGLAGLILVLGFLFQIGLSQPSSPIHSLSDLPHLSRVEAITDLGRPRALTWDATKNLIVNHPSVTSTGDAWNWARPLVGYGPETLRMAFERVFPAELRHLSPNVRVDRAHNIVLDLMATVGLLGLLAFGWVVGTFFFYAGRLLKRTQRWEDQPLLAALAAAVAGYLVTQLVGISAQADQLVFWTLLAVMVALIRGIPLVQATQPSSLGAASKDEKLLVSKRRWLVPGVTVLALMSGILFFSLYINVNLMWDDIQTRKGADLFKEGRWTEATFYFERAPHSAPLVALNKWHLARAYSLQALEVTDPDAKGGLLELAGDSIDQARALQPAEAGYHQRAGLIYSYWTLTKDPSKYDQAVNAFSEAAAVSPTRVNIYNQWADLEIHRRNYERALELLHHSLDIDPKWAPTHFQLGKVHAMLGQNKKAAAAYQRSVELFPTMLQIYSDATHPDLLASFGNPADSKAYAELYVESQPTQWEGRLFLATVYRNLGMTRVAWEQAKISLSLAPASSQGQIRQLMDSLR